MSFIAEHWYIWLSVAVVFGGYAVYNQIRRMKHVLSGLASDGSIMKGVGPMIFSVIVAWIGGILLAISVIINLFTFLKG